MGAPQIILIVLLALGVFVSLQDDGQHERVSFLGTSVCTIILVALLWWGGFWG